MAELKPLPKEMMAGAIEDFINAMPVESVQVTDRHGPRDYGPPEPENAPQSAAQPQGDVVTPPWAQSAPEAPQSTHEGAIRFTQPMHATEEQARFTPSPTFNQPRSHPPTLDGDIQEAQDEANEGRDLTLEERVEWLEDELARVSRRLQSTLEVNNLWDGA